jgi:hypothetical protein
MSDPLPNQQPPLPGEIHPDQEPTLPEEDQVLDYGPDIPDGHRAVELLSWVAPTRVYDRKPATWFLGLFAAGLVAIVVLAFLKEIWFILLVAATIFVYYAMARVQPTEIEHRILTTGVETGGRLYPWKDLTGFSLVNNRGVGTIIIATKLYFPHALELLLTDISYFDVEKALLKYLPQKEQVSSNSGSMADQALVSVANALPGRDRLLSWLQKKIGV